MHAPDDKQAIAGAYLFPMLRSFTKIRVPRATRSFAISPLCLGDTKHKPPILPGTLLNCPKCTKLLPTPIPVCPNCAYISRMNNTIPYHTLFQLPLEPNPFVVDTFKLKQKYLEAQKLCHPDAWAVHGEVCRISCWFPMISDILRQLKQ